MQISVQRGSHKASLFCPVCGAETYHKLQSNSSICSHVVYVYFDETGTFEHVHPDIQSIVDEVLRKEASHKNIFELYFKAMGQWEKMKDRYKPLAHPVIRLVEDLDSRSILHLGIETSACFWVGYDFSIA